MSHLLPGNRQLKFFIRYRRDVSSWITFVIICLVLLGGVPACEKQSPVASEKQSSVTDTASGFILSSPVIGAEGLLPIEYTCDGESASPPIAWSGFPGSTKYFALIMHHEASPTDIHWYWVLYNIPDTVNTISKNATVAGILGNNSVNGRMEYAPPCSQGPGRKDYIITVYALSDSVTIDLPSQDVTRDVLLNSIKNITISSASMVVWYSRSVK